MTDKAPNIAAEFLFRCPNCFIRFGSYRHLFRHSIEVHSADSDTTVPVGLFGNKSITYHRPRQKERIAIKRQQYYSWKENA